MIMIYRVDCTAGIINCTDLQADKKVRSTKYEVGSQQPIQLANKRISKKNRIRYF
jgi:hypothetical protein